MMVPIKPAWVEHIEEYRLVFEIDKTRGTGYSFPCDKHGQVYTEQLSDVALENYYMCRNSGVESELCDYSRDYRWAAVLVCECGAEVVLDGFTNTCPNCEADYNASGQRLAPRRFWGEETGETAADILMGGLDDD